MTSRRENILAGIEAALTPLAPEVERMPSSDPIDFPALHILDDGQSREESEVFADRFSLALSIEGYCEGEGGSAVHTQLNQLQATAVQAVQALEGTLGIEVIELGDLRVAIAPLASARRLAFAQDFTVIFATRRGDPETL